MEKHFCSLFQPSYRRLKPIYLAGDLLLLYLAEIRSVLMQ